MPHEQIWQPLAEELDRWNHAGRIASFWLRDDDAVEPTARLDRLLGLTRTFAIPAVLAVIPARTDVASRLAWIGSGLLKCCGLVELRTCR